MMGGLQIMQSVMENFLYLIFHFHFHHRAGRRRIRVMNLLFFWGGRINIRRLCSRAGVFHRYPHTIRYDTISEPTQRESRSADEAHPHPLTIRPSIHPSCRKPLFNQTLHTLPIGWASQPHLPTSTLRALPPTDSSCPQGRWGWEGLNCRNHE